MRRNRTWRTILPLVVGTYALLLLAFTYGILMIPLLVNSLFAGRSGESAVPRF